MSELNEKTAIVTGGARGIGRAIVQLLAEHGASIAVFDVAFPEDFDAFAEGLREKGTQIEGYTVDITSGEAVEEHCAKVASTFGSIDILVNNAGITRDKLMLRMGDDDWDLVMAVNLKGAFLMTRAVAKTMMRQRKGKIINISSVVGVMGNAGQANYAASKAGMIGLTKSSAKEFASRNINVNAIAPGYVETEMTHVLSDEQREAFLSVIPLKRGCSPEEIAHTVSFLASEKSDYITGQVINVDGGMIM
ncbi:3-oxoacyl-[acyl-carrier-protein] reductase [bacterium]|nr:3-oxoacyl-[acyl-carrier-protein] reductase [bacterium]